ncbi:arylsulfatase, partial [Candidatus Methanophagaceae archaeon]
VIGRTVDQSSPAWPEPLRAKEGAPNVLFIVLDDTGFGQFGSYGAPIETPNLDALAENGLRYNNMHTTALCSPSRTCILTGRNHHSNNMASITEGSTGFPGYNANIPFENGFLSEMLQQHGYNTYAIGKWHLTPAEQISAASTAFSSRLRPSIPAVHSV